MYFLNYLECFKCNKCDAEILGNGSFFKSDDGKDGVVCSNCI